MVNYCASVNCSNKLKKGCGLSFHRFPLRNADLLDKWIKAMQRKNFVPNHHHKLCSVHFTEADFYKSSGKRILKENVVPSIFDFTSRVQKRKKKFQKEYECEDENRSENYKEIKPPATISLQPNFKDTIYVKQEKEPLSEDIEDICMDEEVILDVEAVCVKEEFITEDVVDVCVKEENILEEIEDISVKKGNVPDSDCGEINDAPSPEDSFSNRTKKTNVVRALSSENKIHPGETLYRCDECQCGFEWNANVDWNANLTYHKLIHFRDRKYQCDICQKGFKRKQLLSYHMKTTHKGKPYECDKCHKCFATKVSLSIHKLIHAGKSTYQCDICKKTFATNEHLSKHKLRHEEERAYQCDKCEKSFKAKKYLLMHKKKHISDSEYQCQESFITEYELSSHQEGHTEKRTYQCIICKQMVQGHCIHFVVLERNSQSV